MLTRPKNEAGETFIGINGTLSWKTVCSFHNISVLWTGWSPITEETGQTDRFLSSHSPGAKYKLLTNLKAKGEMLYLANKVDEANYL